MYIICTLASSSERSDMASCTDMAGYYYVAIIRFHVQCCWLQQHCQLPVRQRTIYFVIMGELRIANSWLKQTKTIKSNLKYISLYLCIQQIAHILKLMNILSKDPDISEHHTEPFEMCGTSITCTTRTRLLSTHWIGECHIKIHSDHTTHTAAMQLIPLFVNIKSKSVFSLGKIHMLSVYITEMPSDRHIVHEMTAEYRRFCHSSPSPLLSPSHVVVGASKLIALLPVFHFLTIPTYWNVDVPAEKSICQITNRVWMRHVEEIYFGNARIAATAAAHIQSSVAAAAAAAVSIRSTINSSRRMAGEMDGEGNSVLCARWKSQQIENRSGNKIKWFWKIDFS